MQPHPSPFAGQGRAQNGHRHNQRHSGEFRAAPGQHQNGAPKGDRDGHNNAMPVPTQRTLSNAGTGASGAARSPPAAKNTSHVPCKFFRSGTCQAGKSCPFLHGPFEVSQPCKYFQKGNCKFGLKCANDHITQDGRRVNKQSGYVMGPGPLNLGGRVQPLAAGPPSANSLLTMQQDQFAQPQPIPGATDGYMNGGHLNNNAVWRDGNANIDSSFVGSIPKSNYGSPQQDSNLLMSPSLRGIGVTAANAQLPASFDSQGISKYARDGPFAASVPSRFGFDASPPAARPIESSALRNLHSSAFGDEPSSANRHLNVPNSPPVEEGLGRRILHSERYSRNTTRMLSSSVGARPPLLSSREDDWDDSFALEEEMVPSSLHDLLTPAENARRFSRNAEDGGRPILSGSLSGLGTPNDGASKVGSPSHASPSRFGGFFAQRAREGSDSSPFGPIGSPLKGSGLHPGASPSLRATANARPLSEELGPGLASPPRQASMSMISQQLQRTRLSERVASSENTLVPPQHPGISRVASGGSSGHGLPGSPSGRMDRAVSSSSVGREKIEEEPEELFTMEGDEIGRTSEDLGSAGAGAMNGKENGSIWRRSSGGGGGGGIGSAWTAGNPFAVGKSSAASPRLGPIGRPTTGGRTSSLSGGGGANGLGQG